ncbi:MAG: hypothetical protein WC055_13165 [Melioribacteraceae bacterium]
MKYNLHNLIEINVSEELSPSLKKSIDFQLSYYKINTSNNIIENKLNINPFPADFVCKEQVETSNNSSYSGDKYFNREIDFFIQKIPGGFDIKTNGNGFLINYFIQLILLSFNKTFIHAAAVRNSDGSVILFPSHGGIGKTGIVGHLVKNNYYQLLGDDLVIVGEENSCHSFLRKFVIKNYHFDTYPELIDYKSKLSSMSRKKAITKFIKRNIPFADALKSFASHNLLANKIKNSLMVNDDFLSVSVNKLFKPTQIAENGVINKVIHLKRYSSNELIINKLNRSEFVNRSISTLLNEWENYSSMIFNLSSFNYTDFCDYIEKQKMIFGSIYDSTDTYDILIPQDYKIESIINEMLSKKILQ